MAEAAAAAIAMASSSSSSSGGGGGGGVRMVRSSRSTTRHFRPAPLLLFLPLLGSSNGGQGQKKKGRVGIVPAIRRKLLDAGSSSSIRCCDTAAAAGGAAAGGAAAGGGGGASESASASASEPASASASESSSWVAAPSPAALVAPDPRLSNADLLPTAEERRELRWGGIGALWLSLVIGVPSYYLAGSLVEMGMAWWQGVMTVALGNVLLYMPLQWTGHAGVSYGISYAVMARASFGIRGAHVATLLRGLVACGWFGIESWIGGQGIYTLLSSFLLSSQSSSSSSSALGLTFLGSSPLQWASFLLFWAAQAAIICHGLHGIDRFQQYCAPLLLALSLALLAWAYLNAGGFGAMLAASSQFGPSGAKQGQFWQVFLPALTANIGFWATLCLNIADFTRFSKRHIDPIVGHAGLPIFMGLFSFLGLAVTCATGVIFGSVISNPIQLIATIGGPVPILTGLLGLILATLTTNLAANVVAPANALVNLSPHLFTFRSAALLTASVSILFGPWNFIKSSESFINTWLLGCSALLGPLNGIVVVDYHVIRRRQLVLRDLYSMSPSGIYWYTHGYNPSAIAAFVLAVLPSIPGLLLNAGLFDSIPAVLSAVYDSSWIFGFLVGGFVYWILFQIQIKWLNTRVAYQNGEVI